MDDNSSRLTELLKEFIDKEDGEIIGTVYQLKKAIRFGYEAGVKESSRPFEKMAAALVCIANMSNVQPGNESNALDSVRNLARRALCVD